MDLGNLGGVLDKLGDLVKDPSALTELVQKVGGEKIIDSLKDAIQNKDYQKVEDTARSLNSAASGLGLKDLSQLRGEVLSAVKEKRFGDLMGLAEKLKKEYDTVVTKFSEAK